MSLTSAVEAGTGGLTTGKATGVSRVFKYSGGVRVGLRPVVVGMGEYALGAADWGRLPGDRLADGNKADGAGWLILLACSLPMPCTCWTKASGQRIGVNWMHTKFAVAVVEAPAATET